MIEIILGGIRKLFGTKSIVQSALGPLSNIGADRTSIRVSVTPSSLEQEQQASPSGDLVSPALITPHVTTVKQATRVLAEERQEQPQDRVSSSDDLTNRTFISRRATRIQGTSTLAEQQPDERVSLSSDQSSLASVAPYVPAVKQGTLVLTQKGQEQPEDRISSSDGLTNLASITPRVTQIHGTSTLAEKSKLEQPHEQVSLSDDQAIPAFIPPCVTRTQEYSRRQMREQAQERVSSSDDLTNRTSIARRVTQIQGTSTLTEKQKLAQSYEQVSLSGSQASPVSTAPHVAAMKRGTPFVTVEERQDRSQDRVSSSNDLTNLPLLAPRVIHIQGTSNLVEQQELAQFHEQVPLSGDQAGMSASFTPHVAPVKQGTPVLTEERQERPRDRVSPSDDLAYLDSIAPRAAQRQETSTLVEQQKLAQSHDQVFLSGDQAIPASIAPHAAAVKQGTLVLTEERQKQSQDRVSSTNDLTNLASIAPHVTQIQGTLTLAEQQGLVQPHEQVSLTGDQAISALISPCVTRTQEHLIRTEWQMQGPQEPASSVLSESDITTSSTSAHFSIQGSFKEAAVRTLS